MIVSIPLTKDGAVTSITDCYKVIPYLVTSIKSGGTLKLRMSEAKLGKTEAEWPHPDIPTSSYIRTVSAVDRLAELLAAR